MAPRPLPFLATILLLACAVSHAAERQLPGRVLRIIDGDSLVLDVRGAQFSVELAGIDAPELNQPWGPAAAARLHISVTGSFVVVRSTEAATGGRLVGSVMLRGRDIALDQLYDGLAWSLIGTSQDRPEQDHPYAVAERQAREGHRGLWSDEQPIPPWEWRRR